MRSMDCAYITIINHLQRLKYNHCTWNYIIECKHKHFVNLKHRICHQWENNYEFKANDENIKEECIKAINRCKEHQCISVPITIRCERNNHFNYNHQLIIPYDPEQTYSINTRIGDIIKYTQKKYISFEFIPCTIKDSFLDLFTEHDLKHLYVRLCSWL